MKRVRITRADAVGAAQTLGTARGGGELTEIQIARRLGVSRGRVSQILNRALKKLRSRIEK